MKEEIKKIILKKCDDPHFSLGCEITEIEALINKNYLHKDKVMEIIEKAYWAGYNKKGFNGDNQDELSIDEVKVDLIKQYGL